MSQFGNRLHYSEHAHTIRCPHCGKTGTIKWEDSSRGDHNLVGIEGNFYERLCRKAPYRIELVCKECGVPQKLGSHH